MEILEREMQMLKKSFEEQYLMQIIEFACLQEYMTMSKFAHLCCLNLSCPPKVCTQPGSHPGISIAG
jgi:hypothetical protein